MERLAFFALFLGWISLDPVYAKGLLKPILQQEDKDLKSAFQKLDDPFKHFAAEPEVSSALVVASNTSEKQEKQDVGSAGTALVLSDTSEMDCSDMKNHAAAATGIMAAGATILAVVFPPAAGAMCLWSIVAGVATAANGLTNYIDCPESTFQTDWQRVRDIAQQVYKTESANVLVGEIKENLKDLSGKLFFQEPTNELDDYINIFDGFIIKYIVKDIGYESADLLLTISGFVSDLHMLSLMKTNGVIPNSEPSIEGERTCSSRLGDYKKSVDRMKDYMDTLLWMNARRKFLSSVTCEEKYKGVRYDEKCNWNISDGDKYCRNHEWVCTANYGGISYEDDSQEWRDCTEYCFGSCEMDCTDPSLKSTRKQSESEAKTSLVDKVFKPKYQKWYDSVHKKWEALYKIHKTLSETTDTKAEQELCGKYEKPYCFPRFIPSKNQLNKCCDSTIPGFKCGQLEGTCDTEHDTGDGGNNECKPGYKCVSVKSILDGTAAATQEEKDYLVDRAKWDQDEIYQGRIAHVCFKSGETLPVYKDKDIPQFNRFHRDPCDDSAQCGKDLVCTHGKYLCEYLDDHPWGERMRDSSGNGGYGYTCIDNSDCAGTGRVCMESSSGSSGSVRCWFEGEYSGDYDYTEIPTPMAKAAGASCVESTECDVGHCCHKDSKTCVRNSKDDCMKNSIIGDGDSGATCGDSSGCGEINSKRCCCSDTSNQCWTIESVHGTGASCLPDPLRGGHSGMGCYDSSDCIDGNCCSDTSNECWTVTSVVNTGQKCLRDPTGGGMAGTHRCESNSDCASGNCSGDYCTAGPSCVNSADCADNYCCSTENNRCWESSGLKQLGKYCWRDPAGRGVDGLHKCDMDSDCASNNCSGGFCGGGHSGASCDISSDCADNNCCSEENNRCWENNTIKQLGKYCLRNPNGVGVDGLHKCDMDSDCASNNCNGGICGGGHSGATCADSSECADNNCCFEENNRCWENNTIKQLGKYCLRDPTGGGVTDLYKCTSHSDCASNNCEGGICKESDRCTDDWDCPFGFCIGGNCEVGGVPWSHDESPEDEHLPTEAPCCENGENLISKILHAKSDEGGEHTMGLKNVIKKVLM